MLKRIICVFILVFVLSAVSGCGESEDIRRSKEIENSPPVIGTTSIALINAYKSNRLKAEELFEQKVILAATTASAIGRYENSPSWLYIEMASFSGYRVVAQVRDVYADELKKITPKRDGFVVKGLC